MTYGEIQIYSLLYICNIFGGHYFHEKLDSGPILTLLRKSSVTAQLKMAAIGEEEQFQKLFIFCLHIFFIWKHSDSKKYYWKRKSSLQISKNTTWVDNLANLLQEKRKNPKWPPQISCR